MTQTRQPAPQWRPEIVVWLVLLALFALTLAAAYAPFGKVGLMVNLAIASIQAMLVAGFFMGLRHAAALVRLVAFASLFWLAVMFALTMADIVTRS